MSELHKAILAFQAEAPTLRKDATNPHFRSKFTPLDTIVETIRPLLTKHGLTWVAMPSTNDGVPVLRYRLTHAESGESLTETIPLLLTKEDPQGLGSAITYARRYALSSVLNLVSDDDDDGNTASRPAPQRRPEYASDQQQKLIFARAKADGVGAQQLANAIRRAANRDELDSEDEATAREQVDFMLKHLPPRLVNPVLEQIAKVAEDVPDMVPN